MNALALFSLPGGMPEYQQQHLDRRISMSWRPEVGLPPPPSQIDQYKNLHHALIPSNTPHRQVSPSAYDMQFGGEDNAIEAMPMNTVTKHPKLKLKIVLSNTLYEAGESISGSLEITSSTSQRLRLGEIAIELEAFEELTSRDHSATQIFLFNRTLFQGEHLPPSNAVLPAAPVHGHWTARKGRTTFPFSFRLPAAAPSSVNFAGNAHLRYGLKGTVQTWWNETKSIVTVRSDAFVVEKWHDELDPRFLEPLEAVADTHIFMGGSGAVWLEAGVTEQLFASGGMVMIRAGVKNNTKRHISGIKVCIARRLIFPVRNMSGVPAQRQSLEPQITEIVHSQMFKGSSFEFPPNEEVVANLAVDLPRDLRTIRKTRLFEVQIVALISAQMGNFAKDLTVEIPIYVAHLSSLQRAAIGPLEPLRKLPQRSQSAMSQHGYHDLHQVISPQTDYSPHLIPLEQYGTERDSSPAPFAGVGMWPPSRPTSAAPNVGTAPYPVYSPSPEQFAFIPGRLGQEPQVMWDSNATDWNNSQALLQQQSPRPVSVQELNIHPQQSTAADSIHLLTNSNRQSNDPIDGASSLQRNSVSYNSPQPQSMHSQMILPTTTQETSLQPPTTSQSGITVSQLLSLGAIPVPGLATIEEDSESAAGTVRSIRTLAGSVGRNDIVQFEAMVDEAQQEEERNRDIIKSQLAQNIAIDKTLPKYPFQREAEVFDVTSASTTDPSPMLTMANVISAAPTPKSERQLMVTASPARPTSAQGQGLMALENRLGSQQKIVLGTAIIDECIIPKSRLQDVTNSNHMPRSSENGGLRAAAATAMERERKARQESEESTLRRQVQTTQAKTEQEEKQRKQEEARRHLEKSKLERAERMKAQETEDQRVKTEHSLEERGERKSLDVQEQKKLNKEAVGRVAGWLSTPPNNSSGVGQRNNLVDSALSPKTPIPSVFRENEYEYEISTCTVEGLSSPGTLDHLSPTLSADLRALIDSNDARPVPKQGTAIRKHIGSRRFSNSGQEMSAIDNIKVDQSKISIPSAASRGIPTSRTSLTSLIDKQREVKMLELKNKTVNNEGEKYDSRSARGGKGGRVASVANMWASIADGTDGSMIKCDDAPVLTLKPRALRSGMSGSSALDFTKSKTEESRKLSAMEIFANATLRSNEAIRNSPLKTKKAATFVNTTSPKPVFAKVPSPILPALQISPSATRVLSIKKEEPILTTGQMKESRRLASDLIAREAAKLKTGRDLQVGIDSESLLLPMNGRGTTKPIGRSKLADLRSVWGN